MPIKKFYIKEAIKFGWEKMKSNFWILVTIIMVVWLGGSLPAWIEKATQAKTPALSFVFAIISVLLQFIISIGLIKISLKLCDSQKPKVSDLFSGYPLFLNYLIVSIVYGLIVMAGFILLIVPGIIWAIKYQFAQYLVIDKGYKPIEAIKKSGQITKDAKWSLLLLGLLSGLINVLGAIALVVGLFATVPTTMVAKAFVYRKLLEHPEAETEPQSTSPTPPVPII